MLYCEDDPVDSGIWFVEEIESVVDCAVFCVEYWHDEFAMDEMVLIGLWRNSGYKFGISQGVLIGGNILRTN